MHNVLIIALVPTCIYEILINFPHRVQTIHYESIYVSCRLEPMPLIKRKSIDCALNHATTTLASKCGIAYIVEIDQFISVICYVPS